MTGEPELKPMPLWESVIFFGIPTAIFYLVSRFGITLYKEHTSMHGLIIWFLNGGPFFFDAVLGIDCGV